MAALPCTVAWLRCIASLTGFWEKLFGALHCVYALCITYTLDQFGHCQTEPDLTGYSSGQDFSDL